jgi:hypothetical protein
MHEGMDFTAKTGAPFLLDGIVVEANNNRASGYEKSCGY